MNAHRLHKHSYVFHDKSSKMNDTSVYRNTFKPYPNSRRYIISPPSTAIIIPKNECYMKMLDSATRDSYQSYHCLPCHAYTEMKPLAGISNAFITPTKNAETIPSVTHAIFQPSDTVRRNTHIRIEDTADMLGNGSFDPAVRSEYSKKFLGIKGADSKSRQDDKEMRLNNLKSHIISGERNPANKPWISQYRNNYGSYSADSLNSPSRDALFHMMKSSIPQGDPTVFRPEDSHSANQNPPCSSWSYHKPSLASVAKDIYKDSLHYRNFNTFQDGFTTTHITDFPHYNNISPYVPVIYPWSHSRESSLPKGDSSKVNQTTKGKNHSVTRSSYRKPSMKSYSSQVDTTDWHQLNSKIKFGNNCVKHPVSYSTTMQYFYPPYTKINYKLAPAPKDNIITLKHFPKEDELPSAVKSSENNEKIDRKHYFNYHSRWTLPSVGHSSYLSTYNEVYEPQVTSTK